MSKDHSSDKAASGAEDTDSQDFAGEAEGSAPPAGRGRHKVPDTVERLYLRIDDRYFFPDRTLAFIDDGNRIRVRTENRAALQGVVAIAQARGWRVLKLKGTESFRQGMWREATLHGIEVHGYKPTPAEILQVQRALKGLQPSQEPERKPTPQAVSVPGSNGSSRHRIQGMLMAAAAAPYRFDPSARMSFYVQLRTEGGDRTIWGADLERALVESASQPRIGDQVVLTQHGTHPVNVRVATHNEHGEMVGEKKVVAQRTRWSIETPDHLRAIERSAQQVRSGELQADAIPAEHPELHAAARCLRLAEQYARRLTSDQGGQQRLMELIRERMADALAQGRSIHLPDRRPDHVPQHVRQRTARNHEEPSHERF